MSEWPIILFEELADSSKSAFSKPYGSAIMKDDYVPDGVPVVRGVNLASGIFIDSDFVFISDEQADRMPGANLTSGDLVFTHRGTIGQVSMIPWNRKHARYVLSTSHVKARLDASRARPEFYYYYFQSPQGQQELLKNASVVGVPGIAQPVATIKSLSVPHPPLPVQNAIVETLWALDDKIAVNDQIVRACDELRAVRFAYWMLGHPESVEERPLSSMAEFVNGRAFTKEASGTGRMVIRIAEINSGPGGSTVYNDIEVPDVHLARPGDVLFAWSGSLAVARWFRAEGIINQHIFKVIPRVGIPAWLVFELVNSKLTMFKGIAADKATTMGHIQRRHLDEPVTSPVFERISDLDAALETLWDRALLAEQESLKLAQLRDTLLPKLMSGEIRVRDAEKVVEDVVLWTAGCRRRSGKTSSWNGSRSLRGNPRTVRTSPKAPASVNPGMS